MLIVVIDYGSGNLKSAAKALETAANNINLISKLIVTSYPKLIKEVRGTGLLIGLQLFKEQAKFIKKLEDNKLLTIRAAENVVRILPPLNVKKSEINLAIIIIRKVCKNLM